MKNFFGQNKFHFVILSLFAVYLLTANTIYTSFFLKNGKPIQPPDSIPGEPSTMVMKFTSLENILYDGEDQYELRGYVFSPDLPDSPDYQKFLILHSTTKNQYFQVDSIPIRNLTINIQSSFNIDNSGFRAIISKNILKPDNYQLGFILVSQDGSIRILHMADSYIQREPNRLRLIGE